MVGQYADGGLQVVAAVYRGRIGRIDGPFIQDIGRLVGHVETHRGARTHACDGGQPVREQLEGVHPVDVSLRAAAVLPVHLEDRHITDLTAVRHGHLVALQGVKRHRHAQGNPLEVVTGMGRDGLQQDGTVPTGGVGSRRGRQGGRVVQHRDIEVQGRAVAAGGGCHPVLPRRRENVGQRVGIGGAYKTVV